ncbi:MAG: DMT family transporter [Candidatus Nezhaarchaeales archaeon]
MVYVAPRNTFSFGFLLVVLAGICFGSSGVLAKIVITRGLTPLSVVSYRFIIATSILIPITLILNPRLFLVKPVDAFLLAVHSFIGVSMGILLYFQTIDLTSASLAVLLLYLNPVFTMAAARFTLNERITQLKVLAALLVLAGCFLAVKGFEAETLKLNATGLALGLTAALAYAFYTVFGKFLLEKRRLNVESLTLYSIVYAGLSLPLIQILLASLQPVKDMEAWLALTGLALVPTLLGFALYISGLKRIEAGRAGIVGAIEIASALILAFIILGERLDPVQWLGALMVLCGVTIVQKP